MKLPPNHVPSVGVVERSTFGGFGQRMLEKLGWSVGEGLGKRRDGMRSAIQMKRKDDTHGLGLKKGVDWDAHQWTEIYENGLKQLGMTVGGIGPDSSSSEEEEMAVGRQNPDGTASTAAEAELKIYDLLSRQKRMGRWSSRKGKLERLRKQELKQKLTPPSHTSQVSSPENPPRKKRSLKKSRKSIKVSGDAKSKKRKRKSETEKRCS